MNLLIKRGTAFPTLISYLLHPLLMPTYGVLLIFNSGTTLSLINVKAQLSVVAVVFGFTFLLPALLLPAFYYLKLVGNFEISNRNERIFPIAITAIIYYYTYSFLKDQQVLIFIALFILAVSIVLILLLIINFFWKISMHTAGAGGICALTLFLSLRITSANVPFFVVALIVTGLVAYARLYLHEHTPSQIYTGFLLGFIPIFSMFMMV